MSPDKEKGRLKTPSSDYEDARVKVERRDELGKVGKAFNALSETLRLRDRGR